MQAKEYIGLSHVSGPIIIIEGVRGVGFDEMVQITDPVGKTRVGRVLEVTEDLAIIQVFGGSLPSMWTAGWSKLPGFLINIVFAALFLGVTIPSLSVVWKRSGPQLAYG